jgi:arginine repressor
MVILNTVQSMPSKTIMVLNISKFQKTSGKYRYSFSGRYTSRTDNNDLGINFIIISTICTPI